MNAEWRPTKTKNNNNNKKKKEMRGPTDTTVSKGRRTVYPTEVKKETGSQRKKEENTQKQQAKAENDVED